MDEWWTAPPSSPNGACISTPARSCTRFVNGMKRARPSNRRRMTLIAMTFPHKRRKKLDRQGARGHRRQHFNRGPARRSGRAAAGKNPLSSSASIRAKKVKCLRRTIKRSSACSRDDWLRGGPSSAGCPRSSWSKPTYGLSRPAAPPVSRAASSVEDHWIDMRVVQRHPADQYFPKGSNWLMLGALGPAPARLAVEHLCQFRGGICFCVDSIRAWCRQAHNQKGWMEHLKALFRATSNRQALTRPVRQPRHQVQMFTTPTSCSTPCAASSEKEAHERSRTKGIHRPSSCGGTEWTSQWIRFAIEELLGKGIYIATDLRQHADGCCRVRNGRPGEDYKIALLRAAAARRGGDRRFPMTTTRSCHTAPKGRVMLTTPDERAVQSRASRSATKRCVRKKPTAKYPWDGVLRRQPFRGIAATTVVGVYITVLPLGELFLTSAIPIDSPTVNSEWKRSREPLFRMNP